METKHTTITNEINYSAFQNRLKTLRDKKTYKDIGNIIGIDRHAYSKWENGRVTENGIEGTPPKLENIVRLADYYGVSVDYLLGRSDFTTPENNFIGIETGLTDEAIAGLKEILKHDENEADVGLHNIPCMDLLNFMIKTDYMTRTLVHLRNFISPTYRFPVWRDENGNYVPASSLDEHSLHLSSVPDNVTPWNVHTIAITDQYLDSIEMRNVESMFHFMRDRWNDEHDTTKPRK